MYQSKKGGEQRISGHNCQLLSTLIGRIQAHSPPIPEAWGGGLHHVVGRADWSKCKPHLES